ncbi:MAG: hypothetical protein ACYDEN_09390, partial [Acidimicrobiales bacterium]
MGTVRRPTPPGAGRWPPARAGVIEAAVNALALASLVLVVTGASSSWTGRRRRGVRSARRQRRALDTLGAISGRSPAPRTPPDGSPAPQAHVRVVSADAEPPVPTPRPMTGGWRPTRATGAAPFRSPAPRSSPVDPAGVLGSQEVDDLEEG